MKRIKILAVLTGTMLIAGVAWAAWTASGTGNGFAEATTALDLTTDNVAGAADAAAISVETDQLYPGSSGDVMLTIANPNPYTVTVTSVTATGPAVTATTDAACDAATGLSFGTSGAVTGLSLIVPARSLGTEFTLQEALHMGAASDNACQGEIFKVPVSLSGTSTPDASDPD